MRKKTVCVFCGSGLGSDQAFENDARQFGHLLSEANIELVYGGGSLGLMGVVAESCLKGGGVVTGVIPKFLWDLEMPSLPLTELITTKDMHERKMIMWERADGFIVLPGGVGTLEELVEQLTWVQLGTHSKPIILVNTAGYWSMLEEFFDKMRVSGFLRPELEIIYHLAADPLRALQIFELHTTGLENGAARIGLRKDT